MYIFAGLLSFFLSHNYSFLIFRVFYWIGSIIGNISFREFSRSVRAQLKLFMEYQSWRRKENQINISFVQCEYYSMGHRIWENPKNMLLLKNPQFLRNHNETWSKCGTHGLFIFTKFCNDCIKIVDFLIKAYFWGFLKFGAPYCNIYIFSSKIIVYQENFYHLMFQIRVSDSQNWYFYFKNLLLTHSVSFNTWYNYHLHVQR